MISKQPYSDKKEYKQKGNTSRLYARYRPYKFLFRSSIQFSSAKFTIVAFFYSLSTIPVPNSNTKPTQYLPAIILISKGRSSCLYARNLPHCFFSSLIQFTSAKFTIFMPYLRFTVSFYKLCRFYAEYCWSRKAVI